jgi:hypothetical protein
VALTRVSLAVLVLALAATGCGSADEPPVLVGTPSPHGIYSVGATVFGLGDGPVRLASPPVAPLAGWLTPAAVPSPDGRYLAYNSWLELRRDDPGLSWSDQGIDPGDPLATPSLRLYDTRSATEGLLDEGAFSLAWRSDGALAYFKGAERDYRAGVRYVGDIVVRASLEAEPEAWTSERARYIVAAWAGDRLIAYRESEGEALDVLVLDGPRHMRVLAADSALVAISPDGRRAFVEQGPAQGRPSVRVVDVVTGKVRGTLDLTRIDPAVGWVGYAGDWLGDRIVASSVSGLAVFRVRGRSIALERSIRAGAPSLAEPRFTDPSGRHVTAWASSPGVAAFLECDSLSGRCTRLVPLPRARGVHGFPAWRRPLYNPSRPLATG